MEFVSWDDDIPIYYGKIIQMFQTTNQYICTLPKTNGELFPKPYVVTQKILVWSKKLPNDG